MQIRKVEGMRFKVKDAVTLYCVVKCNDETWKSGHATAKGGKDHLFNVRGSRVSKGGAALGASAVAAGGGASASTITSPALPLSRVSCLLISPWLTMYSLHCTIQAHP